MSEIVKELLHIIRYSQEKPRVEIAADTLKKMALSSEERSMAIELMLHLLKYETEPWKQSIASDVLVSLRNQ